MNSNMAFLGSHNVDFSDTKQNIVKIIGTSLIKYQFENLQFFIDFEQEFYEVRPFLINTNTNDRWLFSDLSLDGMFGIKEKRKVFAITGPYGLMLRISDTYFEFMTPIYDRPDWYSPDNTKTVIQWRKYFKQITSLLGGSGTLYITQAYFDKYQDFFQNKKTTFTKKVELLIKKHGPITRPFTDYGNGKYPRYFFDTCTDNQ